MLDISDRTKITLGLAIAAMGAAAWLTRLHALASANTENIIRIEVKQDMYGKDIQFIRESLVEIRGDIKALKPKGR